MLRAPALRGRGERVRAAGIGVGGRPSGKPALARTGGTLSLSGVPGALIWGARCPSAPTCATGCEIAIGNWPACCGLARLEDEAPRRLDRVERGATATPLTRDRQ